MKNLRFISVILCLSFALGLTVFPADNGIKSEIPYADTRDTATSPYWYNSMNTYAEDEAVGAAVPAGYSGGVMKLTGDSAMGITVDFSDRAIPVTTVKALHFRVYYSEKVREVRVTVDAGVSWVLRHEAKKPGQWEDVVITDPNSLKQLTDENGRLGVFGFGFRCYDGTRGAVTYIDEIRAELNAGDDVPPVITCDIEDNIKTTEGKPFVINAVAYDEQEKAEFPIEYIWDREATDGNGCLIKGEYTLTLRAKDSYGNTAEKTFSVTVGERDVTPPVIRFAAKTVETVAGAYVKLNIQADDDCDDVKVVQEWSDGALDKKGRINEGSHTLTLTATDLTGNETKTTVTVTANDVFR